MSRGLEYDDRLVAFVDVLGWAALMKASAEDPLAIAPIAAAVNVVRHYGNQSLRVSEKSREFGPNFHVDSAFSHFSDTFVLSVPAKPGAQAHLHGIVGELCRNLLLRGLLTRGAIVRGQVRHSGDVAFGPAIVEAHELESRAAVYPRVIVSDTAVDYFEKYGLVRRDFDGFWYLDYLRWFANNDPEALRQVDAVLQAKLAQVTDAVIAAKYHWLVRYVAETASSGD